MAKFKYSRFTSPKGIFKFTWLNKPDEGYNGADAANPKYKTTLLIDDTKENREWVEMVLERTREEAKASGVKLKKGWHSPFKLPEDQDEEDFVPQEGKDKPKYDEDFRGKIFFESKSAFKPGLIDAVKVELPDTIFPMAGDVGRVRIQLNPYVNGANTGLNLRLATAQLIEKNTSFKKGVDSDGFDEEEGYEGGGREEEEEDEF